MPKMIVAVEVDATPELVEDHLRKHAQSFAGKPFPAVAGAMVDLKPEVVRAIGALEGAKVLVIEASEKSPHALMAFVKAAGGFGTFWGMASQLALAPQPATATPA